jgi:hypothetical protein
MSYVMLQGIFDMGPDIGRTLSDRFCIGLGIMPFQLLNIGTVFTIGLYSIWAKTPRGEHIFPRV